MKLWKDDTRNATAKESYIRDAAKLWNNAPITVKTAKSLYLAKKAIKEFCNNNNNNNNNNHLFS